MGYFANMLNRNLIAMLLFVALTSCNTIKSLSAKDDTPSTKKNTRNTERQPGTPVFLDDISVTPTGAKAGNTAHSSNTIKQASIPKPVAITPGIVNAGFSNGTLESADWLQLKYAIMMDATVENLNNLPLLQNIESWYGTRYCMGGRSKNCIDCSAFSQAIMQDVYSTTVPRTAQEQYDKSTHIDLAELKEGDLVFFNIGSRRVSHVGVYLQNNKFVHASTSSGVMISDLGDDYWKRYYKGAGRMMN